jgi:hypothetical protein
MSQPIRHGGATARERSSMKLRDIAGNAFPELKEQLDGPVGALEISGLSPDSRKITPGMAFVAVAGTKADGAGFIADAAARGATVAIAAHAVETSIPVLVVQQPRRFLSIAASNFYGKQPETMVAVTGTSRQDLGRVLHPPDLGACRPSGGDDRHHRRRVADAQRLRLADDARSGRRCISCWRNLPTKASPMPRWKPPAMVSTSAASMA